MTISTMKGLALCGLCALLAAGGGVASAQDDHPGAGHHHHHARRAILRQKAAYARAVANGHYGAAERAHLRARAIRHHVRARREMREDQGNEGRMHEDHGPAQP